MNKGVVVYNLIRRGDTHDFVPSGVFGGDATKPGNEYCWQTTVGQTGSVNINGIQPVEVCGQARYVSVHGDAVMAAIEDVMRMAHHPTDEPRLIAETLRARGLVKE